MVSRFLSLCLGCSVIAFILFGGIFIDIWLKPAPREWHLNLSASLLTGIKVSGVVGVVSGILLIVLEIVLPTERKPKPVETKPPIKTTPTRATLRAPKPAPAYTQKPSLDAPVTERVAPKVVEKTSPEVASLLRDMLDNEITTITRQQQVRDAALPCALLKPTIPLSVTANSGWFGGSPKLPASTVWPSLDGEDLRFVCQISLAALPQNLWAGHGPRTGWLAIFMHPERMAPVVLHVDGGLERRQGPGQTDASWFYTRGSSEQPLRDHLPELPIGILGHAGSLPDTVNYSMGAAPGVPDPRKTEVFDLSDPRFHPIDAETLTCLLDAIQSQLQANVKTISVFEAKKLTTADRGSLDQAKQTIVETQSAFEGIRRRLEAFEGRFEPQDIAELMTELSQLRIYGIHYPENKKDGTAVVDFYHVGVCEMYPGNYGSWQSTYLRRLYQQGLHSYVEGATLPRPQLQRLEEIWSVEAQYGMGVMGHAPLGFVYTPYGPGTPNEVLLELPTSDLMGWIWGDVYSVVLFVNRDDLDAGNFDNVEADITN